jgi:mycothione reductase
MDVDLLIIGAGSGNSVPAPEMDGWRIAIVERSRFGGTCLNRGCIPSKMLIYAAEVRQTVREAERFGIEASAGAVHWPAIRDRVFGRIDPIAASGAEHRKSLPNVSVHEGDARFVGERTIEVNGERITGERVVLAAGARSFIPPVPGLNDIAFHTSDSIMRIDRLPRHLIILGGGFIAAELGHVFESLGSKVTIINHGDALLQQEDADISARFTALSATRFDLVLGATLNEVRSHGRKDIAVEVTTASGSRTITGDCLLVATGRVPNGDELAVKVGGVALDERSRVVIDAFGRTSAPGVWALGDIVGRHQLKHMANADVRVIRHNLLHPDDLQLIDDGRAAPHAVFTSPQIGAVGLTEAQAVATGVDHVAVTHDYANAAFGWALEDTTSFVKLIGDPTTGRLHGAHIIGPQAANLIQLLVQGMHLGATVEQLAKGQIYIHPALTEVVEQALLKLLDAMSR